VLCCLACTGLTFRKLVIVGGIPFFVYADTVITAGLNLRYDPKLAHQEELLVSSLASVRTVVNLGIQRSLTQQYHGLLENVKQHFYKEMPRATITLSVSLFLALAVWAPIMYMIAFLFAEELCGSLSIIRSFFVIAVSGVFAAGFLGIPYFDDALQSTNLVIKALEDDELSQLSGISTTEPQTQELRGKIEFRDVVFAYPSRPDAKVLKGVSFVIPAGSRVAFVGGSGSGKA
jgi:ABC-type multidrug transport system fused ATPase/permease subunit